MAKKPTAKTTSAPKSAPVVPTPPAPAQRKTPTRAPAGRNNKAALVARDATPVESTPAPAEPTPSPASVTAPPAKAPSKAKAPARAKKEAALPAPAPTPPPAPIKLVTATEQPAPAPKSRRKTKATPLPEDSDPAPVTATQTAANTLLNIAAKAVKLVGGKAARLKKEVNEAAALNYAARREATHQEITQEEIAIRAYLISEKRQQQGIHAEPHDDWAEAERQLRAEAAGS